MRPTGDGDNPFLRKLAGLAPLSDGDRAMLDRLFNRIRIVDARVDLIREGEVPHAAFVVLAGVACRYIRRSDGQRQIVAILLPGDLCDPNIAWPGRMDHALGTLSDCHIAYIAREALLNLGERLPQLAQALRFDRVVGEAILRRWLVNLGRQSAVERMAHLFCELLVRLEAVGLVEDQSYDLPITQADLADAMGLSIIHLNRTLQVLRRDGLIEFARKTLRIKDAAGLALLADFTPHYLDPLSVLIGRAIEER